MGMGMEREWKPMIQQYRVAGYLICHDSKQCKLTFTDRTACTQYFQSCVIPHLASS